jgi:hypothetical protein
LIGPEKSSFRKLALSHGRQAEAIKSSSEAKHSQRVVVASTQVLSEGNAPMDSAQFTSDEVDIEAFRVRLRKMPDEELIRECKAGRYLCSPMANFGKPPRKVFVIQLEEVKAEWRRRHPK